MASKKKSVSSSSVTSYIKATKPEYMQRDYTPTEFGETYTPGQYTSQYQGQLQDSMNKLTNWNYDPLQDASYRSLAKVYGQRGNIAAKNSLGDAAALNGGYGSSFAVSAAQQARNQYNQELASLVPQLEQAAYGRAMDTYNLYKGADETDYGRFRDAEGDRWNQYLQRYQQHRDTEGDKQWGLSFGYQQYRDAMSDYFNSREFNLGLKQYKDAQKAKSGGGGRSGGGGGYGGYTGGYLGDVNSDEQDLEALFKKAQKEQKKKNSKKKGNSGGGGYSVKNTNRTMTR